jgi:hypothetical protein
VPSCVRKLFLPLLLSLSFFASPAAAVGFETFECITDNDAGDCSTGTTQIMMSVVEAGDDILLTVSMIGSGDGVISQIFIESSLVSEISFVSSVGTGSVAFGEGADGGNLPGGNPIGFEEAVNIKTSNPGPLWGIGRHSQDDVSGQSAEFLLVLTGGTFAELLENLRVGVHVIGYESGGGESFAAVPVPEPSTLMLLFGGVFGLALLRR